MVGAPRFSCLYLFLTLQVEFKSIQNSATWIRFYYATVVRISNTPICISDSHGIAGATRVTYFWTVCWSTVMFIIPACIETCFWLSLRMLTKPLKIERESLMTNYLPATVPDSLSDQDAMHAVLVRYAMIDTIVYIICWSPIYIR